MQKTLKKLVAKILVVNILFGTFVAPITYAQEMLNTDINTTSGIVENMTVDNGIAKEKGNEKVDDTSVKPELPPGQDSKLGDSAIDPDEVWKSQITDPKILQKIKDDEEKLDKELEKYTAKDKDGSEVKLTKEEKRKDKKKSVASLMATRVANDAVTVQPQQYRALKPSVDQTTGALVYKYDFNLPEGIKGLTPKVVIKYNSQNLKDGTPYGYGWDINLPYIETLNKTGTDRMYTDNYFTHSELGEFRNISGNNYGLRVDDGEMWKFTLSANSWIAKDKNGTTYTYGLTTGSRQDNPNDGTQVYRWYLEKVEDVNGNVINYSYYKESGQIYLSQIKYVYNESNNLYRIDFNRVATQSRKFGLAGFVIENKYLINNIKVYTNGSVTREYNLNYTTPSTNSPFSQIISITELGYSASGNTSNTVSFTYSNNDTVSEFTESTTLQLPEDILMVNGLPNVNSWIVVDYNNDGLPDIVKCTSVNIYTSPQTCNNNSYKYYKNNGSNWVLETTPNSNVFPQDAFFSNHFSDINGDKTVDVMVPPSSYNGYKYQVYLHNNLLGNKGWYFSATTTLPNDIGGIGGFNTNWVGSDVNRLTGYQTADLNGDGLNDYLLYSWNAYIAAPYVNKVFLNKGATITQETVNFQNTQGTYLSLNTGNGYPQSTLTETHNDGLTDILKQTFGPSQKKYYYNTGKDWDSGNNTNDLWEYTTGIQGTQMLTNVDLNGDGYADYIQQANSETQYDPNNSTANLTGSWATKQVFINQHNDQFAETTNSIKFSNFSLGYFPGNVYWPCCNMYNKKPIVFVDINGDGLTDAIDVTYRNQEQPLGLTRKVWINTGKIPGMMTGVTTSTGASYGFTYKSSAQYKDASGNSLNPDLPFTIQTVNTMTQNDGNGNIETYTYDYAGGYYYFSGVLDRKFAGFEKVTMTNPDNTKEVTYYHQGNGNNGANAEVGDSGSKIGKVFRVDIYDSANNLKDWKTFKYDEVSIGTDRFFVPLVQTISNYNNANIAKTYVYDNLTGNLLDSIEWGYVNISNIFTFTDTGTDKRSTTYTYLNNTTTNVTVPNNIQLKDQNGNKVTEKVITYDGGSLIKGNPTNISSWVSGSTYNNSQKSYNTAGQVITETDPRGKVTTYAYDSWNLLPTTITRPLALYKNFTYNYAIQKPTNIQNENGRNFSFTYDGAGRVKSELIPNDASPTTQVTKATYDYNDIGNSGQKVYIQKTNNDPTTNYYSLYDGLGRNIRNITQTGANSYVAEDIVYGQKGLVSSKSLPYSYTGSLTNVSGSLSPTGVKTNYYYLTNGDVYQITDAIGTTYIWRGGYDKVVTDPKNNQTVYWSDGFARNISITQKTNNNTVWNDTSYLLRADDKLLKITDTMGNVRNFTYDGEGKRLTAEDLHAPADTTFGTYTYSYDAAGNMITKVTPKGDSISYTYDDINRVLTEKPTGSNFVIASYMYDCGVDGKGQLCAAGRDYSAGYSYNYTPNGQLKTQEMSFGGVYTGSKFTNYKYDTQGNLTEINYPDNTKTAYTYGYRNLPVSVSYNGGTVQPIVNNISYNEVGSPSTIALANGANTVHTYDGNKMYRLTNKTTGTLQNLSYTYDNVGNILTLVDTSNTATARTAAYTYDDLYRLTLSSDSKFPYNISYTYNAIGNITNYAGYTFEYTQPNKVNPYAITSVTGYQTYTYDDNGNLLTDGARTNTWSISNELLETVMGSNTISNTYNYNKERIEQNVNGTDRNVFFNKYYSQQNNATTTKSIFLGNTLIATIVNNTPYYNLTDHLGTVEKTIDNNQTITSLSYYKPFGVEITPTGNSLQPTRKYIGEYNSPLTGYSYLNARYYEANQGQFISQDPVFWELGLTSDGNQALLNPQAQNSYSYANNNPIVNKDPSGRCPWCIPAIGFVGGIVTQGVKDYQNNILSTPSTYLYEGSKGAAIAVAAAIAVTTLPISGPGAVLTGVGAGAGTSVVVDVGIGNALLKQNKTNSEITQDAILGGAGYAFGNSVIGPAIGRPATKFVSQITSKATQKELTKEVIQNMPSIIMNSYNNSTQNKPNSSFGNSAANSTAQIIGVKSINFLQK